MSINPHQTQTISDTQTKLLQNLLDQMMCMKGVRHAIIAVESRDGSFSWAGAKGIAKPDRIPMEVNTPFWTASVTKL